MTFIQVLSAVLGSHNIVDPELLQGVRLVLSALNELIHCKAQGNRILKIVHANKEISPMLESKVLLNNFVLHIRKKMVIYKMHS